MLRAFLILFLSLSTTAFAAPAENPVKTIEKYVMIKLDNLFSDTYNEGEGTATATSARCRIVRSSASEIMAYCSATVKVRPDTSRRYTSEADCQSLKMIMDTKTKTADLESGGEECLENVNDVTEF